jgi:hypothetical protein
MNALAIVPQTIQSEDAELLERESAAWRDPQKWEAACLRQAAKIVCREAEFTLIELAALLPISKTTLYCFMSGRRQVDSLTAIGLWVRLADIRADYGRSK